ncbi:hypothetical protein BTN82_17395 [Pseudomonas chlororaphis]|uniref:Uncharacterized protein n=1 Tax=Pseudomonas chlororaphis TaxID=587753 RepID=A0A1Q8EP15_9PSED|nr:hypothetical protein BTN82_17395 [Pseudomonas chlororaphis]
MCRILLTSTAFPLHPKRFFGRTSQAEIEWMKTADALPAPSMPSVDVSSHASCAPACHAMVWAIWRRWARRLSTTIQDTSLRPRA